MALHCIHDVYVVRPSVSFRRGVLPALQNRRTHAARQQGLKRILVVVDEREQSQYFERIERIIGSATGTLDDNTPAHSLRITGTLDETVHVVINQHIDTVIILLQRSRELFSLVQALSDLKVQVWLAYSAPPLESETRAEEYPLFSLYTRVLTPRQRLIKRCIDLILSCVLIVLTLPLMALIMFAIKLDSRGPVIFRQVRLGQHGRPFVMFKFRSMRFDGHEPILEVESQATNAKMPDDPRLTAVGKIIRRMSLDELPQFFNIFRGDMSLVGPRPEVPAVVRDRYESWQYMRFTVPQGLTGYWQVNGRSSRPMYLHTEDDLYYIQNYSLKMDIRILLKTIPAVIRQEGAY